MSQILGLSFNTLTADGKYSCHKKENFRQLIQTEISKQKTKKKFPIFFAVLKYTYNLYIH